MFNVTDLVKASLSSISRTIQFDVGQPATPFEQLISVLPPKNANLLPAAFRWLMTDAKSPLINLYSEEIEIDMEGKRNDWEFVIKVPLPPPNRYQMMYANHYLESPMQ